MARPKGDISVADMITAVHGPITLTECGSDVSQGCDIRRRCPLRENWKIISQVVKEALEQLTLADMRRPLPSCIAHVRPAGRQGRPRTPILRLVKGTGRR